MGASCVPVMLGILAVVALPVTGNAGGLSEVAFSVRNPSRSERREVVRVSLPVPMGLLPGEPPQAVHRGRQRIPAQVSVITRHPDGSARRVLVSFPLSLRAGGTAAFALRPGETPPARPPLARVGDGSAVVHTEGYTVTWEGDAWHLMGREGARLAALRPYGPVLLAPRPPVLSVVENGPEFAWLRWRQDGEDYSREVDLQADRLGRLRLTQRLLRHLKGNGWTPDFGFEVSAPGAQPLRTPKQPVRFLSLPAGDPLGRHLQTVASLRLSNGTPVSLANPLAPRQHRGSLEASRQDGMQTVRFSRLEPVAKEMENLQIQEGMWRTVELVVQPGPSEALAAALDEPTVARADWRAFDAVYHTGPPLRVQSPVLARLVERYVAAIHSLSAVGDDWGSLGGLERYNHCQYIWEDYFRTGDPRLRRVALDYSENYNNFSVYWGPEQEWYGGSRYPPSAETQPWPGSFRTRHNNAVTFCTKGYHGFWLAYEETGDPRFRTAAEQQARWSSVHVHALHRAGHRLREALRVHGRTLLPAECRAALDRVSGLPGPRPPL